MLSATIDWLALNVAHTSKQRAGVHECAYLVDDSSRRPRNPHLLVACRARTRLQRLRQLQVRCLSSAELPESSDSVPESPSSECTLGSSSSVAARPAGPLRRVDGIVRARENGRPFVSPLPLFQTPPCATAVQVQTSRTPNYHTRIVSVRARYTQASALRIVAV